MGGYINIQKHAFLREVWAQGYAQGWVEGWAIGWAKAEAQFVQSMFSTLLEDKFGPLPAWASARLRKMSAKRIIELSRKLLTATKLEDVLSRK